MPRSNLPQVHGKHAESYTYEEEQGFKGRVIQQLGYCSSLFCCVGHTEDGESSQNCCPDCFGPTVAEIHICKWTVEFSDSQAGFCITAVNEGHSTGDGPGDDIQSLDLCQLS